MTASSVGVWLHSERGRIRMRYVIASVVSVIAGQIILAVCFGIARWPAEASNLAAFVVGGVVSYTLHRRWTWGRSGRSRVLREIVPFCVIAIAGLLASTWMVGLAASNADRITTSRTGQTLLVMAASLAAYGALWVVKFLLFDRYLFAEPHRATDRWTNTTERPSGGRR
jgi:putative flippase GtrA